jgi:dethiobiotin synthetase
MNGIFVTGTDTGVGKTFASCVLLHALRAAGRTPWPMKPIAAGAIETRDGRANEDTLALAQAAGAFAAPHAVMTPILLAEPMAPHIAARREGRTITLEPVLAAWRARPTGSFAVVESVGGFRVPLGPALDTVDLARALGLPVVLVVGLRLGCLNHALLTAESIASAGLTLAGWIANPVDPAMAAPDENVAALAERLPAPLLGRLPHAPGAEPATLAFCLDLTPLLASPA